MWCQYPRPVVLLFLLGKSTCIIGQTLRLKARHLQARQVQVPDYDTEVTGPTWWECVGNQVGEDAYPCEGVDLVSFLPLASLRGGEDVLTSTNEVGDVWGVVVVAAVVGSTPNKNEEEEKEYALVSFPDRVVFVDVTTAHTPVYIGYLPGNGISASSRHARIYNGMLYVVADEADHGMQLLALSELSDVDGSTETIFTETSHFFFEAHEVDGSIAGEYPKYVAIDEESGFAYVVGSSNCGGGLYMVDLFSSSSGPLFAGCYSDDYFHDVQCVTYAGPDTTFVGRQLCFACNLQGITVVDVTSKEEPTLVSSTVNFGAVEPRCGGESLTDDHRWFVVNDAGFSSGSARRTTTYLLDIKDLTNPVVADTHRGSTNALAGPTFVDGTTVYQADHEAGLSVLTVVDDDVDTSTATLSEFGYFDSFGRDVDNPGRNEGAAGVYVFAHQSHKNVLLTSRDEGLYVLRRQTTPTIAPYDQDRTTMSPSQQPTVSSVPSTEPSLSPAPTIVPSQKPTVSSVPSTEPSLSPAPSRSAEPSDTTLSPSQQPTIPSTEPSLSPVPSRSARPSDITTVSASIPFPPIVSTLIAWASLVVTGALCGLPLLVILFCGAV